ncbi:MAG: CBS domain-containing protein [Methanothrix sp.]|nr:CBS domain-containing protein [Methanothrix sp.]MCX8206232.1 CBS domain-containing protein [Methanothrix sp.]
MLVKDIMNRNPVTCQASDPIAEAARLLRENRISGMPVLDGDELVGVVSESDLLRILSTKDDRGELWLPSPFEIFEIPVRDVIRWERMKRSLDEITKMRVSDVMSRKPITVSPDASIEEAAAIMTKHRINRLPVVEGSRLVGILTRGDIISGLGSAEVS